MLAHPVLLHKVSRIQILHSITKKPMTHFFVICESLSTVRILPPISGPISPFLNTPCSVHVSNGKRESD